MQLALLDIKYFGTKMAINSFTWFPPKMFSEFYARFAGGVMQGFQLLDRFDHNSSESPDYYVQCSAATWQWHYSLSYYFYYIHPPTGHTWHRSTHFPIIHF